MLVVKKKFPDGYDEEGDDLDDGVDAHGVVAVDADACPVSCLWISFCFWLLLVSATLREACATIHTKRNASQNI